jgi:tetratricopeptide (TPR) repeat protein
MQSSTSLFKLGELPKETIAQNYNKSTEIINAIIAEGSDEQRISNAKEVAPYVEDIFGKSGAADCEALISIFEPQFREKGDDIEFVKSMLRRLRRAKCDESPLFAEATEKLYQLEPSAEAAFNMARRNVKRDNAERAKEYYKQAMDQETDKELLSTYYYEYAVFIFAKEHALQEARNYLRKALEINPDYCEALMLIGDIYIAESRDFQGDDFEKSAIFWVAVDYFERSRQVGEDCDVDAAQKISTYKKYFPNKEEAFFRSISEGQTYKVGGWINESTKVRF